MECVIIHITSGEKFPGKDAGLFFCAELSYRMLENAMDRELNYLIQQNDEQSISTVDKRQEIRFLYITHTHLMIGKRKDTHLQSEV